MSNQDINKYIRLLECNRCGWKWATRKKNDPKVCPKCKSPYWNKERVRFVKSDDGLNK